MLVQFSLKCYNLVAAGGDIPVMFMIYRLLYIFAC